MLITIIKTNRLEIVLQFIGLSLLSTLVLFIGIFIIYKIFGKEKDSALYIIQTILCIGWTIFVGSIFPLPYLYMGIAMTIFIFIISFYSIPVGISNTKMKLALRKIANQSRQYYNEAEDIEVHFFIMDTEKKQEITDAILKKISEIKEISKNDIPYIKHDIDFNDGTIYMSIKCKSPIENHPVIKEKINSIIKETPNTMSLEEYYERFHVEQDN